MTRSSSSSSSCVQNTRIVYGDYDGPVKIRKEELQGVYDETSSFFWPTVWVKVHAVSVNPIDAKQVIGDKLPPNWHGVRRFFHNLIVRHTGFGFDFAGVVVGGDSQSLPPGTRVFGATSALKGSFANYIRIPVNQVATMPSHYTMEQAAALPLVGLTAWQAFQKVLGQNGAIRNVLVIGASGGAGHMFLQVAKHFKPDRIVAVCSGKNADFCRNQCGATDVVDYTQDDFMTQLRDNRFDCVFDTVTSGDPRDSERLHYPSALLGSDRFVAPEYLYQRLGGPFWDWVRALFNRPRWTPDSWVWTKWYSDRDPHLSSRERVFWIRFEHTSNELDALRQLAEDDDSVRLMPHISQVLDGGLTVDNVQRASEAVMSRHVRGKVVIRVVDE